MSSTELSLSVSLFVRLPLETMPLKRDETRRDKSFLAHSPTENKRTRGQIVKFASYSNSGSKIQEVTIKFLNGALPSLSLSMQRCSLSGRSMQIRENRDSGSFE